MTEEAEPSAAERDHIRDELGRLSAFARGLRLDEIREGTWFSRLVRYALQEYADQTGPATLARQYPGRSADSVAQARTDRAARYAGIEGGLSAGAYTALVAATLGSGGGASPLTLPGAGASFVLDLLYTSQLQLKLAYDIAVGYGVPLDLDDPEDLWKLIRVAFVIKGSEARRVLVGKTVPAVVAARGLPWVGRYLLRRQVAKFAVPAVGVPLSVAINTWSTRTTGAYAVRIFRREAAVVETARRLAGTPDRAALLWVLWLVIKADGLVHEQERLLLKHVTAVLAEPESELAALAELERTGARNRPTRWALLAAVEGDRAPLYAAAVEAAAVDGKVNVNELAVLRELAERCGATFDEAAVRARARAYAEGRKPA